MAVANFRPAKLAVQRQLVNVQRVNRKNVVVDDFIVPRRAGTIEAVVVAISLSPANQSV